MRNNLLLYLISGILIFTVITCVKADVDINYGAGYSYNAIPLKLFFDGKPFIPSTVPVFSLFDASNNRWTRCDVSPDINGNGYVMQALCPGKYNLHIEIDENKSNPARYPGDYDIFYDFCVTPDSPSELLINMPKLIHLIAPWDNNKNLDGMLTYSWDKKPSFDTPHFSLNHKTKILFSWEPVSGDAEYSYMILITNESPYKRESELLRGKTKEATVMLTLPPTQPGHYLEFSLIARHNETQVGEFFTHDSGSQGWTCLFAIKDKSLPIWVYPVALICISMLGWLLLRLPRFYLIISLILFSAAIFIFQAEKKKKQEQVLAEENRVIQENTMRGQNFLSEWQAAVPKPIWWDEVPSSSLSINSLGDLMSLWQSGVNTDESRKRFYKLAYQAILNHPDDKFMVPMAAYLMTYVLNDTNQKINILKFWSEKFFYYKQRTDNCANCMPGDTTGEAVRDLAELYIWSKDNDSAIGAVSRLLKERKNEMSDYNVALAFQTLAHAHWAKFEKQEAIQDLNDGLKYFPVGWQADELRKTLETYNTSINNQDNSAR